LNYLQIILKNGRKKITVSSHKKFIKIQEVSADYENLYVLREAKNLETDSTLKKNAKLKMHQMKT